MNLAIAQINIFEYSSYRLYLRDIYSYLKETERGFSYRSFSRAAGFTSPNFIKLVIEEKRNLSPESVVKIAQMLKLSTDEELFFKNLVALNQSKTTDESQYYADLIVHSQAYKKFYPLEVAQFDYYANWYLVPIRELVALPDFHEDPEWIARSLQPPISAAEAKSAIQTLINLKLVTRNATGRLIQNEPVVSTGDEVTSSSIPQFQKDAIMQFHKLMMRRGSEALDRFEPLERDISSLTMTLSKKNAARIKEMIKKFRKDLLAISAEDSGPEGVYQVNFQLFPLTRKWVGPKS